MTNGELVLRKLAVLRDHLGRARRRRPESFDAFVADSDKQDALAMSLLVVIQEAVDIAFHIVTDDGIGIPASNADALQLLANHGVIDAALATSLVQGTGLRNRLAHGYASLDAKRLWEELPAGLDAMDRYAVAIAEFVGKRGS